MRTENKTSQAIRDAVDEYLLYDDRYDTAKSPYLCDIFEDLNKCNEIKRDFILPDVLGWSLFEVKAWEEDALSDEEYHQRQEIRFTLAEIIACHYESIGD